MVILLKTQNENNTIFAHGYWHLVGKYSMIHRLGITVRYFERMKFCFKHFSLGRGTIYLKNGFFVKKNIKLMLARWGPIMGLSANLIKFESVPLNQSLWSKGWVSIRKLMLRFITYLEIQRKVCIVRRQKVWQISILPLEVNWFSSIE